MEGEFDDQGLRRGSVVRMPIGAKGVLFYTGEWEHNQPFVGKGKLILKDLFGFEHDFIEGKFSGLHHIEAIQEEDSGTVFRGTLIDFIVLERSL